MATIYREFTVAASPQAAWDAIRDVGAIHARLARGFVTGTVLDGQARMVTFANGFVVREEIVAIDDEHRRLAYRATGGRAAHHNASLQVLPQPGGGAKLVWITDLLPDSVREPVAQMVDAGVAAMQATLAASAP
jgi:carbon monoxide dehydrogenase subunit G